MDHLRWGGTVARRRCGDSARSATLHLGNDPITHIVIFEITQVFGRELKRGIGRPHLIDDDRITHTLSTETDDIHQSHWRTLSRSGFSVVASLNQLSFLFLIDIVTDQSTENRSGRTADECSFAGFATIRLGNQSPHPRADTTADTRPFGRVRHR